MHKAALCVDHTRYADANCGNIVEHNASALASLVQGIGNLIQHLLDVSHLGLPDIFMLTNHRAFEIDENYRDRRAGDLKPRHQIRIAAQHQINARSATLCLAWFFLAGDFPYEALPDKIGGDCCHCGL
jgi:hypothetical protein